MSFILKLTASLLLAPSLSFAQEAVNNSTATLPTLRVTSGSLIEQSIVEAPASITVISSEDIKKQPVRNVTDVLRYAEGVMITGSNDKGISLRGFDSSYTLILVNGKRLSSRSLSVRHNADADLSWISPNDIERIEVVRGPMATLYGAEAIGGVVNIITKKISSTWNGSVGTNATVAEESEEKSQYQTNATVSGPIIKDKLGIRIGGATSEQNQPKFAATDARKYAGHKDSSFNTQLDWKINDAHSMNFEFGQNYETQLGGSRGENQQTDVKRTHGSVEHKAIFDKASTELRVFADNYDYKLQDTPATLDNQTVQGRVTLPAFNESHVFVGGVDVENNVLKNKVQLASGETKSLQTSVFLEDSMAINDDATFTAGARHVQHEKFGGHLSPRGYLVYKQNSELTYKAGVGTGFKTPTLLQLDSGFTLPSCRGACTMVGNPDLKPETSINYEVGSYLVKDRWSANVTVFHAELTDMINTYFTTIAGQRYRLLHNVDKAWTRGIEIGTKVNATEFVDVGTNVTFTETRNVSQNTRLSNIPDAVVNLQIDWSTTEKLSTYAIASYNGNRKIDGTNGEENAAGYTTFNVGAAYKLPKWMIENTTISGGVENLTNHLLSTDYGYGEPGRRYFVKLDLSFAAL